MSDETRSKDDVINMLELRKDFHLSLGFDRDSLEVRLSINEIQEILNHLRNSHENRNKRARF